MNTLLSQIPLLALLSAVSHAAVFILFGRMVRSMPAMPLLTLLLLLCLPLLFIWAAIVQRTFRVFFGSGRMMVPFLLSPLLFPGFLFLFSRAYVYSEALKLVLIYLSIFLIFESWSLRRKNVFVYMLFAALLSLLALILLLSQGLTIWPLLWAEGAMTGAAVCLCLYRVLSRKWQEKTAVHVSIASFWSFLWALPWLLAAMWISGKGLPLPPIPIMNYTLLPLWAVLFVIAVFVIDEIRLATDSRGDFILIFSPFFPCFVTIFGFMETGYWPDMCDMLSFLALLAASLLISMPGLLNRAVLTGQISGEGDRDE